MAGDENRKPDLDGSSVEPVSLRKREVHSADAAAVKSDSRKPSRLLWAVPLIAALVGLGALAFWYLVPQDDRLPDDFGLSEPGKSQPAPAISAEPAVTPEATAEEARAAGETARQTRATIADDTLEITAALREFGRGETRLEGGDAALADGSWSRARDLYIQADEAFSAAAGLAAEHSVAASARSSYQQRLEQLAEIDLARHAAAQWQTAQAAAASATTAWEGDDFTAAAEQWAEAQKALDEAEESFNRKVRDTMARGVEALSAGNRQQALDAFNQLRELQPDHPQVDQLLQRAETIEEVMQALANAELQEEQGNLEMARIDYQRALRIDPLSLDARSGIARTSAAITKQLFDTHLEQGRQQFEQERYGEAVQSFSDALTLKPEEPAATNWLRRARDAFEGRELRRLTEAAAAAEEAEEWDEALRLFNAALEINSGFVAATLGVQRVQEEIIDQERFVEFMSQADSLANRGDYAEALILLRQAGLLRPDDPVVADKISKFQQQLVIQEKPISVTVISDGQTSIQIYRVGTLGQVEKRTIELRPGEYTIVASRTGYRSVRKTISVEAGAEPMSLTIQCTERI